MLDVLCTPKNTFGLYRDYSKVRGGAEVGCSVNTFGIETTTQRLVCID